MEKVKYIKVGLASFCLTLGLLELKTIPSIILYVVGFWLTIDSREA